jgi:hypothetical protein
VKGKTTTERARLMKKSIPFIATIALLATAAQTATASWGILWLGHGQNVANY